MRINTNLNKIYLNFIFYFKNFKLIFIIFYFYFYKKFICNKFIYLLKPVFFIFALFNCFYKNNLIMWYPIFKVSSIFSFSKQTKLKYIDYKIENFKNIKF